MRSRAETYSRLLHTQADLSFDLEQMFFRMAPNWISARRILDFGSGDGYYTAKLARLYPEKHFTCVESNASLVEVGRSSVREANVSFAIGSFDELEFDEPYDFVFARHAVSYLVDRDAFMTWVTRHIRTSGEVLVVDADDTAFCVVPRLPLVEGGNEEFKDGLEADGGNRDLVSRLPAEWAQHGFSHTFTRSLIVHSEILQRREMVAEFMRCVAEWDHGSPLPSEVVSEIDGWAANSASYLQYGMFGSLFRKENELCQPHND